MGTARALIVGTLYPKYRKIADYNRTEYLPKCRPTNSVLALPDGTRYYAFQVSQQTTIYMTLTKIHDLELAEVIALVVPTGTAIGGTLA